MYPDFLVIGAQKAGTSWLYRNLKYHKQVWLPPVKELHYFDTLKRKKNKTDAIDNNKTFRRESIFWKQLKVNHFENIRRLKKGLNLSH